MAVGSSSKTHGSAASVPSGMRSSWGRSGVGDRARGVHDTAAVGTNINNVGLVGGTNKSSAVKSAEAVGALEVNPRSTEIGAGVELLAIGSLAKDVQVPGAAFTLADRDGVSVGRAGDGGEGLAEVGAVEDARVGGDEELAGCGGVGGDGADLGDVAEGRLGEGGGAVGGDVEGRLGTGVEDVVLLLVAGDDAARGESAVLGLACVADNLDAGALGRPENDIAVGGVGDGAVGDGVAGGVHDGPGLTAVGAEGELRRVGGLADAGNLVGAVSGKVDVDTASPPRVGPGGLRGLVNIGGGLVGEAVVVKSREEELRALGGTGQGADSHLLNTGSKTLDGNGFVLVPVGQVVATVQGKTGTVEELVAVGGVNGEGLDHPAKLLGVNVEEVGLDPGGVGRADCVLRRDLAIGTVAPDSLPGRAGVGGAEEDRIGVPAVQSGDNDRSRFLHIDTESTEAVVEIAASGRGDVGPLARGQIVLPNTTLSAIVRAGSVGIGEVNDLLGGLKDSLVREELLGLAIDRAPGGTGVSADVDGRGGVVGGSNKDSRGRAVDNLGGLVEGDESQTLKVTVVGIARGAGAEGTDGLECRDLGESRT